MSERTPQSPPIIQPVSDDLPRPLWSVMIPTFNCSRYLIKTISSVLAQDPGPAIMQIQVVDDGSIDADVEAIVKSVGKGRVEFFRQQENVGSLRNFETCINRATGHYIHLLHGDDYIKEGFYEEIEMLFKSFPTAGAAFTAYTYVAEQNERLYESRDLTTVPSIIPDFLLQIAAGQLIQPPAIVVKRSVYQTLGSFYGVHYGEDWVMWVRIAANFPVAASPKNLAYYRVHQQNITSRYFLSGQSITDAITVMQMIRQFVPASSVDAIAQLQKKHIAHYFARSADKVYHEHHEPLVAFEQAKRSMQLYFSRITLFYYFKILLKRLLRYKIKS